MKLNHLTDKSLHLDLSFLVQQERNVLAKILWHLREVDARKLYSIHKCGSLYEYAVKVLKYSEGQASRRVRACRLLAEIPELSSKVEAGTLNITHMNQLSDFFNQEGIKDLDKRKTIIEKIEGKATRESERILDDLKKDPTPRKVKIELQQTTLNKLQEVKSLKAHKYEDMDALLMGISETVLDLWNPIKASRKMKESPGNSRYVQVQTKSRVWARDKGVCQNCGSRYKLELDHIKPFAMGGKSTFENLRLLCRNCNQRSGMDFFKKAAPSKEYRR